MAINNDSIDVVCLNTIMGFMMFVLSIIGFVFTGIESNKQKHCEDMLIIWLSFQSSFLMLSSFAQCYKVIKDSNSEGIRCFSGFSFVSIIVGMVLVYGIDHDPCEDSIVNLCNIFLIAYWSTLAFLVVVACIIAAILK